MVKSALVPQMASRSFSAKGFEVVSPSQLEIVGEYNLVKGTQLKVMNSTGEIIHEGVRGFMPLTDDCHLIRKEDGSWWCCSCDGKPKKKSALCKKNLTVGDLALMFDERGKIRLGMQSIHYPLLSLK